MALTELILLIGANPTVNHPVAATWIKNAVDRGTKLVICDPRRRSSRAAPPGICSSGPAPMSRCSTGCCTPSSRRAWSTSDSSPAHVNGYDALKTAVAEATPGAMSAICGIDAATIRVARAFATAKSAMILWGMGVSQHVHGTDNARCLIALALVSGQIGRPGTGLHPLRGQNNVQGASDAGLIPMMLPNYQKVGDAQVRAQFEALWGTSIDARPGLTVVEIMHAVTEGRIKGLYVEGENPAMSDPDLQHARAALARLEHLVVQDIFATETAVLADVILPASAQPEKWGSYTNTDRLIQIGRPALTPPGQAMQDIWIIEQMARRLGAPWHYWRAEDGAGQQAAEAPVARAFEEMRGVMEPLAGVPWSRLVREGAVVTPAAREDAPGDAVVFVDRFPTADGRATAGADELPPRRRTDRCRLSVRTHHRPRLEHWHTGAMTRHASMLDALAPEALATLHPFDAQRLGIADGAMVELATRHGAVRARACVSAEVRRGQVFMPFAFWEAAANKLTGDALDAVAKIPGFKVTAMRVTAA